MSDMDDLGCRRDDATLDIDSAYQASLSD